MFLLKIIVTFICVLYSRSGHSELYHAYSSGDVVIGGLFPIHSKVSNSTLSQEVNCTEYSLYGFMLSQMMIYTIQKINQETPIPGLTLGYNIFDTCGDVSLAIRATLELLRNNSDSDKCFLPSDIHFALPEPQTKVVIGESSSEVSTAVARITALASLAQISYASTSVLLSEKTRFPTFLRTVPSDAFQTEGIYKLVQEFNWKSVAIVGSSDEYGKYGSDSLENLFNEGKICINVLEILPDNFNVDNSRKLVKTLKESVAEAIILFTNANNVKMILAEAIAQNLNRTWIASDTWSTFPELLNMTNIKNVGQVLGFIYKKADVPGFAEYVTSMFNGTTNAFLEDYKTQCQVWANHSNQETERHCLNLLDSYINQSESYSTYLAVQVVAESLRSLLKCNNLSCERDLNFTTFELLEEIKKVNFSVSDTHLYFNNGEPILGYDIVQWDFSASNTISKFGEYWPREKIKITGNSTFTTDPKVSVFHCFKSCEPGHMLKLLPQKCCFKCVQCATGEFSENGTCQRCRDNEYPSEGRDKCVPKFEDFLRWNDPFSIILICLACIAILVTLKFTVLFTINRTTPIVKAVGGYLCYLKLFSLLSSFSLTFTFMGKPTSVYSCMGIPLFGVTFSICISCILANLLQIIVGFNFELSFGSWIKKINHPLAIVVVISGIQIAITVSWLIIKPPVVIQETEQNTVLHQCDMQVDVFFLTMLIYLALLAIGCFLFAFQGRRLPDLYKNSSWISASMAMILIIWLVFLPLFVTLNGKYRPAIPSMAILVSSGSILCCHLAPKCYIMTFKKELNNERAITEYIRKYYERKGRTVAKS